MRYMHICYVLLHTAFCDLVYIIKYLFFPQMQGVRVELCANSRVGLLSDITRVLRENGLAVVRADIATQGEKSVNAFYVKDISGSRVDLNSIKSMKREMGAIDLAVMDDKTNSRPPSAQRPRFSIGGILKSQIERLSHSFVAIK